jgi:hypothetical protein
MEMGERAFILLGMNDGTDGLLVCWRSGWALSDLS